MDELKQAYEKLGLQEDATRDEVEKRYEILLRQERQKKMRGDDAGHSGEKAGFDEINRAYRLILEQENRKEIESITEQQYGKYKRFSGQVQKLDHFFSYYKWYLLGGIAVIALLIYGINAYIGHRAEEARLAALPPVDLNVSFLGQFYLPEGTSGTDQLEAAMAKQIPGWKRVEANVLSFNMSAQDPMNMAMQQKVVVQLATERPDVYILDDATFAWIARNGVLRNLDAEAEGRLKALLPEDAAKRAVVAKDDPNDQGNADVQADGEAHIYGIDIGKSPLAGELPLTKQNMIVGIRQDAKNGDNALKFIESYLQAMQTAP